MTATKWMPPTREQVEEASESAAAAAPEPTRETASEEPLPEGLPPDSTHAFIWRNAEAAARVLRTLLADEGGYSFDGPLADMSSRAVAAAFLCGLGETVGGRVLQELAQREQVRLGQLVARADSVSHAQAMHALEHVRQRIVAGDFAEAGGPDFARRLLGSVMHAGRARWAVESALSEEVDGLALLAAMSPEQAAPFVWHQHPQTCALILSQLAPDQAGALLRHCPERLQAEVTHRLSTMGEVDAGAIERLRASMGASLGELSAAHLRPGGPSAAAAVLAAASMIVEKNVLGQMDGDAADVAEAVRAAMFGFDDLLRLSDRELQIWLRQVDQKELVLALKGASEAITERILGNMSERVRDFINEELGFLGGLPAEEAKAAQQRLLKLLRQLEEAGELTIPRSERAFLE